MMNKKFTFYVNLDKVTYEQGEQHLDEHEHIKYFWEDKFVLTKNFGKDGVDPAMFGTSLFAYWQNKIF